LGLDGLMVKTRLSLLFNLDSGYNSYLQFYVDKIRLLLHKVILDGSNHYGLT
jgi:hypothetical protein